jgi:UPF0755 protein
MDKNKTNNTNRYIKKKKKRRISLTKIITFLVVIIAILIGKDYINEIITGSSNISQNVEVSIPKGSNTNDIAKILKENEVIKSTNFFRYKAKKLGYASKFQYGDFIINTRMGYKEMMEILSSEGQKRATTSITIPEGYSISQISELVSNKGLCSQSEFMNAINNASYYYKFVDSIPNRDLKLQGYVFPSTYEFYKDSTGEEIVNKMLSQFNNIFKEEYYERAKELGMTIDEIITIASIIEKEVRVPEERKRVAGVIYNRLNRNKNLEMCSTVVYAWALKGEPVERDRLLFKHLDIDSPYNTYMYTGLPVGPVANPGEESIIAALYPEEHNYLFFVLKNPETGEHEFNETIQGHNKSKSKYNNKF